MSSLLYPPFFLGLLAEAFKGFRRRLLLFPGWKPDDSFSFFTLEVFFFHERYAVNMILFRREEKIKRKYPSRWQISCKNEKVVIPGNPGESRGRHPGELT